MAKIIDGKAISSEIRAELAEEVKNMNAVPGLAVIIVGNDPASQIYVCNKKAACEEIGVYSEIHEMPEETTQRELIDKVKELNENPKIHGILVQAPLPKHITLNTVVDNILPQKDVDAFHMINVGKITFGEYDFLPCTPAGIMTLLEKTGIEAAGKDCVVVGRSNTVGKPMALLLLHANGTVTVCHSKTKNLPEITRRADILVAAIGKANFITGDMVKDGVIIIDVGINRAADSKKISGDVDFASVEPKASYITPVPGGVGPMTITMLLKNTIKAAKNLLNPLT